MEQKRILWIVVAVCLFVLIIFGFACLLYFPTKSTGPKLQQAIAVPQTQSVTPPSDLSQSRNTDPDAWLRGNTPAPGLDKSVPANQSNINLTIVNGDNPSGSYGTLDVSGLTKKTGTPDAAGTAELQLAPGENGHVTVTSPGTQPASDDTTATAGTAAADTKPVAKPATATKQPPATAKADKKKAAAAVAKTDKKAAAEKPAPAKQIVAGTEYWIQVGSFASKLNAEKTRESLAARYLNAEIFTKDAGGKTSFRVRVGPYKTKTEAEYWLGTIKETPEGAKSFITEIKTKN